MIVVSVKNALFNAPIGLYPQESKTMNQIAVDISVSQEASIDALPFIDYTALYLSVKTIIDKHHKTLEEIVVDIHRSLKAEHPNGKLDIKVRKLHPPISGKVDYTEVAFKD